MSHAKWKQGFASCMDQKYSLDSFHPKTKIDKLQIYLRREQRSGKWMEFKLQIPYFHECLC